MRIAALTSVLVFAIDQASKFGIVQGLNLIERGEIDFLPPYLVFRMAWNTGINFGLGGGLITPWVIIAVSIVISAAVWIWVQRSNPNKWAQISAGLLIGGALGNVIDRMLYGAVADFLNMSCCGFENPYAFNVADIAIFAGAAGLALFTGNTDRKTS